MADADTPPAVGFHPAGRRTLTFESYRFDFADGTLSRDGNDVLLPPRAVALLAYLLERHGRVVPKQELMDAVWKEAHVSETSLTEAIGVLRQALGDDSQQPRFIQTVHRRGYRFIAPIAADMPAPRALTLARAAAAVPPVPHPAAVAGLRASLTSRAPTPLAAAIAAAAALVAGAVVWLSRAGPDAPRVARLVVALPPEQAPAPGLNAHTVLALSPDGRRIVYVAGHTGSYRLFVRALDRFDAVPIAGTDGGHGPFFSPDGGSVGFFRDGRLIRIALDGGEALPLADAKSGFGGSWGEDGTIVFAPGSHTPLWRVPAAGGDPVRLTNPAEGESHRWPDVLPDGRGVLFTVWRMRARDARIVAWREGQRESATIVDRAVHPRYLPSGHLAFIRDATLMVAPFDVRALRLTGPAVPAVNGVMTGFTGAGQFSVASSGALLYLPADGERRHRIIVRVDGGGSETPLPLPPRPYQNLALSPDGRRLAATIPSEDSVDIWIGDLFRGSLTRLTSQGTNVEPVWSPDGRHLTYASDRSGRVEIYRRPIDGSAAAQRLWSHPFDAAPGSWSPDGRTLAFFRIAPETKSDVMMASAGASVRELIATRAAETAPRISPDGRWLAYQSNESGRMEIYLRPIALPGRVQVSQDGGSSPAWVPGRSELTFRKNSAVMLVRVSGAPDGAPALGAQRRAFDAPDLVLAAPAPDGSFIAARRIREHHPLTTMNVVLDWLQELNGGERVVSR